MTDARSASQQQKMNQVVYLKDYQEPEFAINSVDLEFELSPDRTIVHSVLQMEAMSESRTLILDGEGLELLDIQLDGEEISDDRYQYQNNRLEIHDVPESFELKTTVCIAPEKNTQLSGLYQSSGNYCTQCEAEGFRRITFFLDRPDVLSVFTVKIIADKETNPILLSNGNPIEQGDLDAGKHFAIWHDPHPKPSYLFALVAGKLEKVSDEFTTASGNKVALNVWSEPHNVDKCDFALQSLIKSMEWDEQVYGREYDLEAYNVVAVDDFNMGAMENKGLNVFNSKFVLALPDTATDSDFEGIESVIGHEYFHNWSGNRVTCRDWFQLSLKEGFTVFRDQEFSGDMGSRGVKRVNDVNILRTHQFKEDAGPMSHPVRPASYEEINNFYTVTVYNKGAEVVRMLHTILGVEQFRSGTDLYFDRHDGQAVTTDDFVKALEDANDRDFNQFKRWYDQAGTPVLMLEENYSDGQYALTVTQSFPEPASANNNKPFHMPIKLRLLSTEGDEIMAEVVWELTEETQILELEGIPSRPVLSFLRGYSAPVKVEFEQSEEDLDCLIRFDDDPFVRWEAMQKRMLAVLLEQYKLGQAPTELSESLNQLFIELFDNVENEDPDFFAELLMLPNENYLSGFCQPIKPHLLRSIREAFFDLIASNYEYYFKKLYANLQSPEYEYNSEQIGHRRLKNLSLGYLVRLGKQEYYDQALEQFKEATNMTDSSAAMGAIVNSNHERKIGVLKAFYKKWQNHPLVLDKWFAVQASTKIGDVYKQVQYLTEDPAFSMKNPNKVRALLGTFAQNIGAFHQADGEAYEFYADKILELDAINPQVAARMVSVFNTWKTYFDVYADLMKVQLQRIESHPGLSKDVREIVTKALEV